MTEYNYSVASDGWGNKLVVRRIHADTGAEEIARVLVGDVRATLRSHFKLDESEKIRLMGEMMGQLKISRGYYG